MEKQYNVFIQWNENTNNYRRFDRGVMAVNKYPLLTVEAANTRAAEYLYEYNDNFSYNKDILVADNRGGEVAIDLNKYEPASYDFGDGTIYVAEVVE